MTTPLDGLTSETFKQQLHTKFRVQSRNLPPVDMELTEVLEPRASAGVELFCLHFLGPGTPRVPQQISRFEHDKLGALDMFMTAVAGDERGITYEVVFHRVLRRP